MIPFVCTKRLKQLGVGESVVLMEPAKTTNAGAPSQCYASRAGIKITTAATFLVIPTQSAMIKAILITRTE